MANARLAAHKNSPRKGPQTAAPVRRAAKARGETQSNPSHGKEEGFAAEVAEVVAEIQTKTRTLLLGLPVKIRRAIDLTKHLGIDNKLASNLFRLLTVEDPLAVASLVPGPVSMRRFQDVSLGAGLNPAHVAALGKAAAKFETMVKAHAQTRLEFESMILSLREQTSAEAQGNKRASEHGAAGDAVGGARDFGMQSSDAAEAVNLRHRKATFGHMSHFMGIQASLSLNASILIGDANGQLNHLPLRYTLGLRRLRQNTRLIIDSVRSLRSPADQIHPLNKDAQRRFGASLLPAFCSQPVPKITTSLIEGVQVSDIESPILGRQGSVDVALGNTLPPCPLEKNELGQTRYASGMTFDYPMELSVMDLLVHRKTLGKFAGQTVDAWLTLQAFFEPAMQNLLPRLSLSEGLQQLGQGIPAANLPEAPRYPDLLKYAFETQSWNPNEFDVYRLRIEYPLVNSCIRSTLHLE